ncbi:MAG: class I SAM-dependent methyltransferase [Rhodothermia bacterium]|nr:class I SAM-dependent methyltransferase [Rhodothermia bacterium]
MNTFDLLIDFHKDADRQGPGSPQETQKALYLLGIKDRKNLKIVDIGCGTGAQTMVLAEELDGHITAVDLSPVFLEKLRTKAQEKHLQNKIQPLACAMDRLPFHEGQFDLVWSEGAIYNMGFEQGIQYLRPFLKEEGFLAVSELSWFTETRPDELTQFWEAAYPEIQTISRKIKVLEENGYTPLAHFVLPEYCWLEMYYTPMLSRFEAFATKHNHQAFVKQFIDSEKEEIAHFNQYKAYYGYAFYLASKRV